MFSVSRVFKCAASGRQVKMTLCIKVKLFFLTPKLLRYEKFVKLYFAAIPLGLRAFGVKLSLSQTL
jgi:hypothetical protein